MNPLILVGRCLVFIIILLWSFKFVITPMKYHYAMESFWHLVNLPFHDAGWIKHDHALAHFTHTLGCLLIILALVWAGYILYKQYRYKKASD